jgi:tetratricopeptide (TPR) repeat protein
MIQTLAFAVLLSAGIAGQRGGSPPPSGNQPQQPPSGQRGTSNQPPVSQPNNTNNNTTQPSNTTTTPDNAPPIYISGNVRLSDGTPAPPNATVRIICGISSIRTNTYAGPDGNFNIVLNSQRDSGFTDPDLNSRATVKDVKDLTGCEVRAVLGGYLSTTIILDRHSSLDNPDIGTIYLHPIAGPGDAEGYTVSLSTKLAPKDARKEYEKGLASEKQKKWTDAEQEFQKAVTIYPKYAIAWYELGRIYREQKKLDDAQHAQQQAIDIEPKFMSPYAELTQLSYQQQKWEQVVKYTSQMIKYAPYNGPEIYFYNAAANFNLRQLDAAEKSVLTAARLDEKHKVPRINYLYGLILAQRHDYKGAVENLRLYLQASPSASDADAVQKQMAELEKAGEASPEQR